MSILTDVLGIGSAAASGGLFGLLGTAINSVTNYFQTKQQNEFKLKEWDHETELQKLQMQAKSQETEQEIKLTDAKGAWDGLNASIQADEASGASYPWVNAVKNLTRPAITLGLTTFLAIMMYIMGPGDERSKIIDSLTFAAVTSIVWWFGDRAPQKQTAKKS